MEHLQKHTCFCLSIVLDMGLVVYSFLYNHCLLVCYSNFNNRARTEL